MLDVPVHSSVADLKRRISAGTGNLLPPSRMQLVLERTGTTLEDQHGLMEYGITEDNCGIQLFIMVSAAALSELTYHKKQGDNCGVQLFILVGAALFIRGSRGTAAACSCSY